jgi:hypothetical protein
LRRLFPRPGRAGQAPPLQSVLSVFAPREILHRNVAPTGERQAVLGLLSACEGFVYAEFSFKMGKRIKKLHFFDIGRIFIFFQQLNCRTRMALKKCVSLVSLVSIVSF